MSSNGIDEASLEIRDLFQHYGVTENGYRRPSSRLIWDVFVREWEDRSGRDITGVSSAELQYVEQAVLWTHTYFEALESVYNAAYFSTAVGAQLDQVLSRHGFYRLQERQAEGEVTFFVSGGASEDIQIDAGTRVATGPAGGDNTIYFETTEPVTIRAGVEELSEVSIKGVDPTTSTLDLSESQTGEATNVESGAIDRMIDSVGSVEVSNPLPTGVSGTRTDGSTFVFESGRDRETDHEFRQRYLNTLGIGGRATVDAIRAAVLTAGENENDVRDVEVEEDLPIRQVTHPDTGETMYVGRQFETIVAFDPLSETDPNPEIVSQALLETRAAGINATGPDTAPAVLEGGAEYSTGLAFREAEWIDIYVDIELDVTREWNSQTSHQVRENIVQRIGGEIDGEYYDGRTIGEDVFYSRVLGDALAHDIESWIQHHEVQIGKDPTMTNEMDVPIERDQIAIVDPENIDIVVNRVT